VTASENRSFLLDTSALFTLIDDEDGADRVEQILRSHHALIPCIAGLEVYYVTRQQHSEDEANRRLAFLHHLPATWLNQISDSVIVLAGGFKAQHRVSLADALVAAFAVDARAILVHKDPEFRALARSVSLEELPLKGSR